MLSTDCQTVACYLAVDAVSNQNTNSTLSITTTPPPPAQPSSSCPALTATLTATTLAAAALAAAARAAARATAAVADAIATAALRSAVDVARARLRLTRSHPRLTLARQGGVLRHVAGEIHLKAWLAAHADQIGMPSLTELRSSISPAYTSGTKEGTGRTKRSAQDKVRISKKAEKVRRAAAIDAFTDAATPPPQMAVPAVTPGNAAAAAVGRNIANM